MEDPSTVMNMILEAKVPFSCEDIPLLFSELQLFGWLCRPLFMNQCPHFFINYITFFFLCVCARIHMFM